MSTEKPGTAHLLEEITAGKWILESATPKERLSPKDMRMPSHFVIIGTSGSYDYLKDSTSCQRFWHLSGTTPTPAPNEITPLHEPDEPIRILENFSADDNEVHHAEDF